MKSIIVFFNNEEDVAQALNSFVEAGLDVTGNISMIMTDIEKNDNLKAEPFDENEFDAAQGAMSPLESKNLDREPISVPGIGEIIIAGAILNKLDLNDEQNLELKFDEALIELGIPDVEIANFETRINSGQILIVLKIGADNYEEVCMIFSDAGAMLMNYDMNLD